MGKYLECFNRPLERFRIRQRYSRFFDTRRIYRVDLANPIFSSPLRRYHVSASTVRFVILGIVEMINEKSSPHVEYAATTEDICRQGVFRMNAGYCALSNERRLPAGNRLSTDGAVSWFNMRYDPAE
jgi:hypothetical protein